MIAYRLTRREVVRKFDCSEFAYIRAADELGLWADPVEETAKLRATIVQMMGTGKRAVSMADFLPDAMTPPDAPDPEADVRAMNSFIMGFKNRKK